MRTTIATIISTTLVLAPTFALAQETQSTPPPETVTAHPNTVPPTRAPEEPLPVYSITGEVVEGSGSAENLSPSIERQSPIMPIAVVVIALLALASVGWMMFRQRRSSSY